MNENESQSKTINSINIVCGIEYAYYKGERNSSNFQFKFHNEIGTQLNQWLSNFPSYRTSFFKRNLARSSNCN